MGKSGRARSGAGRAVVGASGIGRIGTRGCGIGFMGSAARLGASLTLMSIGPIEIDRLGSDLAGLGIEAIRLVSGPSRIGCRIHTIKGVDSSDFHADRMNSATLSADRRISAELWCERFGAVFSIALTPDYLATIPFRETVPF